MRAFAVVACALIGCACGSVNAAEKTIKLEAESAQLSGTQVAATRAGYSGSGYVTGIDAAADKIVFKLQAKAGIYELRIGYCAPHGEKGYVIAVNGSRISGVFPATAQVFSTCPAGKVELVDGANTIAIEKGWGWYDVDYIQLDPATTAMPRPVSAKLVDPAAAPCANTLIRYLVSQYGSKMLSGQYDQYDAKEVPYIQLKTGKTPAILGGDLMDYSPSRVERGADPKGHVEQMIASARQGVHCYYVLALECSEWAARYYGAAIVQGFYTEATTFDLKAALDSPASKDYKLLIRDIDAIAVQLKKFADAGVPVLWRPLHEAEGGWFWWGAKGPDSYIRLWRIVFDRLTNVHKLHNLIWVQNCVKPEWYPGDAYVDIVSVDAYPSDVSDPLSATWDDLIKRFDGKKLLAVSEFGGVPDVKKMYRFGARWLFFATWPGATHGPRKMTTADLTRIYTDPLVLNKEDVRLPVAPKP